MTYNMMYLNFVVLMYFKWWRDKLLLCCFELSNQILHVVNKLSVWEIGSSLKQNLTMMNYTEHYVCFSESIWLSLLYSMLLWRCECDDGYTGSHCETEVDLCLSSPCQNNATCISQAFSASVQCLCSPGFGGKYCETCK